MEYRDFYLLAKYANENWKGSYTEEEVACNAYNYLKAYEGSLKKGCFTKALSDLYELLSEDNSEECRYWRTRIKDGVDTSYAF